jgi:ribosomal subunit interface protein
MKLIITGRNIETTPSIQLSAEQSLSKLNERFPCISQSLVFEKQSGQFTAVIEYKPEHGASVIAKTTHAIFQSAVKSAASKIEKQLAKIKSEKQSKIKKNPLVDSEKSEPEEEIWMSPDRYPEERVAA